MHFCKYPQVLKNYQRSAINCAATNVGNLQKMCIVNFELLGHLDKPILET